MKLNAELRRQLVETSTGQPSAMVDDACELLTGQVVLWLKAKQKKLKDQRAALPLGDPDANRLADRMRLLGELIVELAEAP